MAVKALVQWNFALTNDGAVRLGVDRLMDDTLIRIGDWYVELRDGNLIVRSMHANVTLLTVRAQDGQQ